MNSQADQTDLTSPHTDSDEDDGDDRLAAVKNQQFDQPQHFVMADDHPDLRCVTLHSSRAKELHLAPGQGKIPTNLMRDDSWDVCGFPHLHPKGQFGLHHPREVKISAKSYFMQRLQNKNPQFRKNKSYLFAAMYFLERQQFEQRINLSVQRGQISSDGSFCELKDAMSVFDNIKGTPKYWQKKRIDMIAKIEQLGPFQFFFTLSCADKRWDENFVSILSQMGHKVTFEKSGYIINAKDDPWTVLVDGIPLHTFLKDKYPNMHELVKDNIFTITKVFDKRLQNFISQIIMAKNSPMKTQFWQYRIEFQARGAGHAHGVLWLDLKKLDSDFPGIESIYDSIKTNDHFSSSQLSVLQKFIDTFISCSLDDENVKDIVKEVQIHHHSKTCRKYGSHCRFGFPRYPSEETIVAQPLNELDFPSKEELECYKFTLEQALKKVDEVLQNMDQLFAKDKIFANHLLEKITLDDILMQAGIEKELKSAKRLYYEALKMSSKGKAKTIILRRTVQEMWVNNYNPEWILAWNGNMDIQLCLDMFAICTYITDYYTKDESGTLHQLVKAAKECHGKSQKEKMRALSHVFLTHRHVGESEAYYKICSELCLTNSNVTTVFQHSGLPNKRNVYLRKLIKKLDE